ncbi:MAG: hypothetical protein ACOX2P_00610 [Bacillota bacterium]
MVVENNPIRNIQAIRNVVMVFREGRLVADHSSD